MLVTGPGDICASDVQLATTSNALLLAFNVKVPAAQAKDLKGALLLCPWDDTVAGPPYERCSLCPL